MRMLQLICTILALFLFLPAAQAPKTTAIEVVDLYKAWDAAFNKRDAMALGDLYDEDSVLLPTDHQVIKDRRNIEKFFDGLFKAGFKNFKLELVEAGGHGDMIFGAAKWSADDGKGAHFGGVAMHVFTKQEDGTYKIRIQTWN